MAEAAAQDTAGQLRVRFCNSGFSIDGSARTYNSSSSARHTDPSATRTRFSRNDRSEPRFRSGSGRAGGRFGRLLRRRTIFDDDGGGGTVKAAEQGFTLEYPDTWKPVSKEQLALFPGSPGSCRARGELGLFVVRKESKAAPTKQSFGDELDKEIGDRVPDYEPGSVRTVKTAAGPAFYFSYARTQAGTANSIVVVPDGSSSFVLESASAANDRDAAKDVAAMIGSFGIRPRSSPRDHGRRPGQAARRPRVGRRRPATIRDSHGAVFLRPRPRSWGRSAFSGK